MVILIFYFMLKKTKKINWTFSEGPVLSDIDDEELDSHVTTLVEGDLEKFDPADEANITSSKDSHLSTASIDIIQQKSLQQSQSIGNVTIKFSL